MKVIDINKCYDIVFVGAGPSTIGALMNLVKHNYNGDILVIEQGKSLKYRQNNEVISGFCGAGAFSDSKLSVGLDVGGIIPTLTEKDIDNYEKIILDDFNSFIDNDEDKLSWSKPKDFDTSNTILKFQTNKVCHVGTDKGRKLYLNMEDYLMLQKNITFLFETEVVNIDRFLSDYLVNIDASKNSNINIDKHALTAKKVVLATGQKSKLPQLLARGFNLKTTPRALQLGIRVEDQMNEQYEKIIEANYDFKFTANFEYSKNIIAKVRTFCCNSGNAHTCAEVTKDNYTCFNGHALKAKDENNHTVNYGIMCELENCPAYKTKEEQIKLMQEVNSLECWKEDNFDEDKVAPKRKLLNGFEQLSNLYPTELLTSLNIFVNELNKIVDLSKAKYLYPEIKLSGEVPDLDYNTFETKEKNLYMIGDCACTRGIFKAYVSGYMFADNIIKEKRKEDYYG